MKNNMLILFMLLLPLLSPASQSNGLPMDNFAKSGITNNKVFHLWDLASANPKHFAKIFEKSVDPVISDFRGKKFNGIILYVNNWSIGKLIFTSYTGKYTNFLTGKLNSRPLTFQKRFYLQDNAKGESGINYWPMLEKESMSMRIYSGPSIRNPKIHSLKIDYNVSDNKVIRERPLIDEIRKIPGSDLYIGKMYYRLRGKNIFFLWFALEKVD